MTRAETTLHLSCSETNAEGKELLPSRLLADIDPSTYAAEETVAAEQAFGQYLDDNLQSFKRSEFADDMELQEGLVISFADAAGGELPGVIKTITEQTVMIVFNHPLAGRDILFTAEIHSVDAASSED